MKDKILFYESPYYFFSNFSSFAVEWKGKLYMTSEHAYQAEKFQDETLREVIRNAKSAHDCKKLAGDNKDRRRKDWQEVKVDIMRQIVLEKFKQHPYIQKKLAESGDAEIIENSPKDAFWGIGPDGNGQNMLGKIWMEIRSAL